MPRAPDSIKLSIEETARLAKLYESAEREILNEINRCLLKGNKTEYLKAMLTNVQAIRSDLDKGTRTWCSKAIPKIYINGVKTADREIKTKGGKVLHGFASIHQQAAKVLADSAYSKFDDSNKVIGRRVDDIYRSLALENVRASAVGYQSWQKVARNLREQLADEGVTGFKDRTGRQWNMRTYAEMVARTTTMEAHLEGTKTRLLESGHDLVEITKHSSPCKLCAPWEGMVLSLTGRTDGYPALDDAKKAGLFHPNCRHDYGLYIDLDAEIDRMKKELGED